MTASRMVKLAPHTWVDPVEVASVVFTQPGGLNVVTVTLRSGKEISLLGDDADAVVLKLDPSHRMPEGS